MHSVVATCRPTQADKFVRLRSTIMHTQEFVFSFQYGIDGGVPTTEMRLDAAAANGKGGSAAVGAKGGKMISIKQVKSQVRVASHPGPHAERNPVSSTSASRCALGWRRSWPCAPCWDRRCTPPVVGPDLPADAHAGGAVQHAGRRA